MTRKSFLNISLLFLLVAGSLWSWMWLIRQMIPGNPANISPSMYKGITPETNPWLEPWQRWDTPHYQAIAEYGYPSFENALFTPPLYPWLIKLTTPLFGNNSLAAGLFISSFAFFACLIAIYMTTQSELKNERDAFQAALFLASFPTAFFLLAAYNESLFLLGAIMSLYTARRKHWIKAGLWGVLAVTSRLPGIFLLVPLAFAAFQEWKKGEWRGWLAPIIVSAGGLIFPLYAFIWLDKTPLDILEAVSARGGHLTVPGWNIIESIIRIGKGQLIAENLIELFFTLLFLALTVIIWRKLPRIYGIYSCIIMLLFISRFGSPQPLVGMARYVLEIFPAFLILAMWGRNVWGNRIILILSWLGLLFFSAQFAIWGWVG